MYLARVVRAGPPLMCELLGCEPTDPAPREAALLQQLEDGLVTTMGRQVEIQRL